MFVFSLSVFYFSKHLRDDTFEDKKLFLIYIQINLGLVPQQHYIPVITHQSISNPTAINLFRLV